jgi:hypothetical protein
MYLDWVRVSLEWIRSRVDVLHLPSGSGSQYLQRVTLVDCFGRTGGGIQVHGPAFGQRWNEDDEEGYNNNPP